jgi:phage terminase small subunit
MARGRASAAAKEVQKLAPGGKRPAAPSHLTADQRKEWRAIVDRLPAGWFTRENFPLLAQYCRHVDNANRIATAIDALADIGDAKAEALLKMAEREGRAMSSLATRLRLTQQSRYNAQAASTAAKNSGTAERKPWE